MQTKPAENKNLPKAKWLLYVLLALEILLGLCIGLLGGELNDIISLSAETILLGLVLLLILSFFVAVATIRHNSGEPIIPSISLTSFIQITSNEFITVFTLSAIIGIVVGFVSGSLFPGNDVMPRALPLGIWDYEIAAYLVAFTIFYIINMRTHKRRLVLSFSIGYGFGVSLSLLLIHPFGNDARATFIGWIAVCLITGLIQTSRTFHNFVSHVKNIFRSSDASTSKDIH